MSKLGVPSCICGCGHYGALTKSGHVRGCVCRACIGRRNRRGGLSKQRAARKRLGIPPPAFHGQLADEESWRGFFRAEVKSGKQVGAVSQFLRAENQAVPVIGDPRPFAFVQMPDGWGSEGLVTVRLSVWEQYIGPRFFGEAS